MIPVTALTRPGFDITFRRYLATWGAPLRPEFCVRTYPSVLGRPHKKKGYSPQRRREWRLEAFGANLLSPTRGGRRHYIFSDLERLSPAEKEAAAGLYERLRPRPATGRMLNHPTRSRGRYRLLRTLCEAGWNDFNLYWAADRPRPERWPVFYRGEDDHDGAVSALIYDQDALERALDAAAARGDCLEHKVVIEFMDSADSQGVYHKYAAFRVGDHVIPRHAFFSKEWILKHPALRDEQHLRAEREYLHSNPHEAPLREIFALAGIDYGRVDYAVVDGRIQVWEINTNPTLFKRKHQRDAARRPHHDFVAERLAEAFEDLG